MALRTVQEGVVLPGATTVPEVTAVDPLKEAWATVEEDNVAEVAVEDRSWKSPWLHFQTRSQFFLP